MACSASSGVAISTNPKPRDRPVSRSVTTLADSTAPAAEKASRRRSVEVENERPPTKSLTAMRRAPFWAGRFTANRGPHAPEYTLSGSGHEPDLLEVRSGRDPDRAPALRRAVPRPVGRRARSARARRGPDRRGRHPLARGGLQVVARAPRDHRGRAARRSPDRALAHAPGRRRRRGVALARRLPQEPPAVML